MRAVDPIPGMVRILALTGLVAAVAGCAALGDAPRDQAEPEALYGAAAQAQEREAFEDALEHLTVLTEDYPETPQGRQALLDKAYVRYRLGDHDRAVELAGAYLEARGDDEEAEADVRYALHLRAAAAHAQWDRHPPGPEAETALARRAFGFYREVVERFPESERAEQSMQRMNRIREDLAEHELALARARFEADHYAEAAERAAWVAEQYPGMDAAGEALALQARALERLGREREAEATRRLLEIKHPEHPQANQAGGTIAD